MPSGIARFVVGSDPRRTAIRIVVLVAAAFVIVRYAILPVRGDGISMQPTVRDGQLMIVDRVSYRLRNPVRGELTAVTWGDGEAAVLIKRILAGPGDTIAIRDGVVLVNDVAIAEPYVESRQPWNMAASTMAGDEYFIVGDNRGMPMANHTLGRVPRARLIGPVAWIVGR